MVTSSRIAPALSGVGAVLLLVVGNEVGKVGGGSPDLHASAAEYTAAVGSSRVVVVGIYLVVAGFLALTVFFRVFAERLRGTPDADRTARAITAGGVLAGALGVSGALPLLAVTAMAGDGDLTPELAKALQLMDDAVFVLSWLLVAVPMATAALVAMRRQVLGRMLGCSGAVIAALLAVASVAVWWTEDLVMVWLLGLIWIAVAGIALARRAPRPVPPIVPDGLVPESA
jgi:hypothetical protein